MEYERRDTESSGLNNEGNDDQVLEVPPPPDGGYGWVIVFASFMCNLVVDGIAYTFGVFLGEFANHFGEGRGTVAWVGSLLSGTYLSVGPIVSALANRYGCRAVCIAGAILAASGFVLSTFSTSLGMLMITYGVLGGIGFGMIYLPAIVAVGYYFETKRSLATGLAVCGSGVGTFTFAPLATYLLEKYDWKNANIILAGLILNCAVFGALMRPLRYYKDDPSTSLMQRMYTEKKANLERGSIGGSFFVVQLPDGTMERRMKMPMNADPGVHSSLALDLLVQQQNVLQTVATLPTISEYKQEQSNLAESSTSFKPSQMENRFSVSEASDVGPYRFAKNSSQPLFTNANKSEPAERVERMRKISTGTRSFSKSQIASRNEMKDAYNSKFSLVPSDQAMVRPFSRKDIFYSGTITNLKEYQSQKSLRGYRMSVLSFSQYEKEKYSKQPTSSQVDDEKYICCGISNSFMSTMSELMDFRLLNDPVFMCIGLSNLFGMAGLYVPFVYIVDAAVSDGIPTTSASTILSVIGIVNTFGRILCGYIADLPSVDSLLLNNFCLLLAAITVGLTPFCNVFASYLVVSILFGIAIAGYISLTSIILVDLLGLDKLTNAFGLLILCRGIAAVFGSPLAGLLYDLTSSYDLPFFVAGALFGLSAVTSFLAPFTKKFKKEEPVQIQLETLDPIHEDPLEEEDDDQPITLKPKILYNWENERKGINTGDLKHIREIDELLE